MQGHRLISPFNRFLIVLVGVVTIAGFFAVPLGQDLPIHWGISGQPDNFAPAPLALVFPAGMMVAVLALLFVLRRAQLQKDFESGRFVIDAAVSSIAAMALVLCTATILIGLGVTLDMPRVVSLLVTGMFVVIGNVLPKTKPNWVAGIRLPWTLRDAENWRVTHRWTGRTMVVSGLIGFAVAAVGTPSNTVLMIVVLASAFIPVGVGMGVSYVHAVRHDKGSGAG